MGRTWVELGMQRGWWLPQDTRLGHKRVRGLWRLESWNLGWEEGWVLEWKGLLGRLRAKC